jgi:hypothetical protein
VNSMTHPGKWRSSSSLSGKAHDGTIYVRGSPEPPNVFEHGTGIAYESGQGVCHFSHTSTFCFAPRGVPGPPAGGFLSWYLPRYPHSIKTQSESTHLTSTWRLVYSFHTSHVAPPMSRTFISESPRPAFSIRIENPEVKLICVWIPGVMS